MKFLVLSFLKKKYIILIILIIIILITIILNYNTIRYHDLCNKSDISYFIMNYSTIPRLIQNRVVISFTTVPTNLLKIKPMILSLLDQTIRVDQIFMVIPWIYKGEKYNIPEYINDIVSILRISREYGEMNNVIPVLFREKDDQTIIIACRDDMVYNKNFVELILKKKLSNPNSLIIDNRSGTICLNTKDLTCSSIDRRRTEFDKKWLLDHSRDLVELNIKTLGLKYI